MRAYAFHLILETAPDLDATDRLYGHFGADGAAPEGVQDVTLVVSNGRAMADCSVEATSFDEALGMVLPALRKEGLRVVRVEMDEDGLALLEHAA
ncbi:MAG: hypothetical protein ACE10K_09240 [Rhodothermales bacterium]